MCSGSKLLADLRWFSGEKHRVLQKTWAFWYNQGSLYTTKTDQIKKISNNECQNLLEG